MANQLRRDLETRGYRIKAAGVLAVASFPYVSAPQSSNGYSSFCLIVDSTARTGGTSITPSIEEWDEAAQAWEATALLTGAAIATADTRVKLHVSPHMAAAANLVVQTVAPRLWRVRVIETGGITSANFSLGVIFFN